MPDFAGFLCLIFKFFRYFRVRVLGLCLVAMSDFQIAMEVRPVLGWLVRPLAASTVFFTLCRLLALRLQLMDFLAFFVALSGSFFKAFVLCFFS